MTVVTGILAATICSALLFYQSAAAKAADSRGATTPGVENHAGRTLRVSGRGSAPPNVINPTVRREMAERAALSDARRKLVQALADLKAVDGRTLESRMGEPNFSRHVEGFIKGYTVTGERELSDRRIEIDLELPLADQGGVSSYLEEQ